MAEDILSYMATADQNSLRSEAGPSFLEPSCRSTSPRELEKAQVLEDCSRKGESCSRASSPIHSTQNQLSKEASNKLLRAP